MECVRHLQVKRIPLSNICFLIIWLQKHARSDWLFSSNDRVLLVRCPRHMLSVFNLIVDILVDIHVIV